MPKGTLVVLEGLDGSGKTTQYNRLCERLSAEGRAFHPVSFPDYASDSSALVRQYLAGAFGARPGDVTPYAASSFYAVDRYASFRTGAWGRAWRAGGAVLAARYTTSNAIHQAPKLADDARGAFLDWLFDYEYQKLALPVPDRVVYLDMPVEASLSLLRGRGGAGDIHERDEAYLRLCRDAALAAARRCGWTVLPCADGGRPRPIDEIHKDIYNEVVSFFPTKSESGDSV